MEPITIIVPAYNCEKYIGRCIDSILCQSFSDLRLIIIDDGSTDSTGFICRKYASLDTRIFYYRQDNTGVSAARNNGLKLVNTPYLMFVDSDDTINENLCEILLQRIDTCFDMSVCGFVRCFYRGEQLKRKVLVLPNCTNICTQLDWKNCYGDLYENTILTAVYAKVFRTDIIHQYNIYFDEHLKLAEDVLFNQHYQKHCTRIAVTNLALYNYNCVIGTPSLTSILNQDRFKIANIVLECTTTFTVQKGIYDKAQRNIIKVYYKDCLNYLESLSWPQKHYEAKKIVSNPQFSRKLKECHSLKPDLLIYYLFAKVGRSLGLVLLSEIRRNVKRLIRG